MCSSTSPTRPLLDDDRAERQGGAPPRHDAASGPPRALARAARPGRVTWSSIPEWLAAIESLGAAIVPLTVDDEVILDLAERPGITWGDAHWVHVAARLDRPLVTADRRLAQAIPDEVAIVVYLEDQMDGGA